MDAARGAAFATVGAILVVTVATGPVGFFEVPERGFDGGPPGEGTASVTVVSPPDGPTLDAGRQGGDVYYLRVPDVEVDVSELRGNPTLTYSLDVDGLNYNRGSVHFLGSVGDGRAALSLSRDTLDGSRIDRESYRARVTLTLRTTDAERIVYNETTVVEVRE